MKEKIKFGLIGCGNIGIRHAKYMKEYGELIAVCDNKAERVKKITKEYSCQGYDDLNIMLANEVDIDLISICTPNYLHSSHSIKCLQAGYHVLCEKPMAIFSSDCELMIKTSEKYNKRLFVVKQNRFNPGISELKDLLDRNILGQIYSFQVNCFWNRNEKYYEKSDWKGKKEKDGGILYTQFSHFIDIIYWLLGDVKHTKSYVGNYRLRNLLEFEDSGVVIMELKNGAIGTLNYTINCYENNFEGSITIFAENGTVKIGGQYLNNVEYQNIKDINIESTKVEHKFNDYGYYQGSMSNHDKVYQNIVDVLNNNASIVTNFIDGLKTVQIIEQIYASTLNEEQR